MENSFFPDIQNDKSDSYKLLLYIRQLETETESRLKYIENQLEIIKNILKQGGE